ncbi:hypothetical protein G5714_004094 [Onychostoma macrolepis]|uniref:Retrotransposon gag domain-containing protein n=1 Tax=Onychostoma macrolepis TaxID=369639 RepID=A0A7J6DC59_9TELE|nr:hypothetical protein G5714_004094 [Onychostoma macrolepis]
MDLLAKHPENALLTVMQDGRSIEDYVEEFLQLVHKVPWNDGTLKTRSPTQGKIRPFLLRPFPVTFSLMFFECCMSEEQEKHQHRSTSDSGSTHSPGKRVTILTPTG